MNLSHLDSTRWARGTRRRLKGAPPITAHSFWTGTSPFHDSGQRQLSVFWPDVYSNTFWQKSDDAPCETSAYSSTKGHKRELWGLKSVKDVNWTSPQNKTGPHWEQTSEANSKILIGGFLINWENMLSLHRGGRVGGQNVKVPQRTTSKLAKKKK